MTATLTSPPEVVVPQVRRRRRWPVGKAVVAAACALVFLWPVVMVAVGAFRTALPGTPGSWTAQALIDTYTSSQTYSVFWQTIVLAVSVTVLSTLIALFLAWVVARSDTPMRGLVSPMMALVLATPPLFFAVSWDMLGNQRVGLINKAFMALTGAGHGFFNVESWPGLIFVCSIKAAAFSYFLVLGPFMSMDRSQEEASLTAGASRTRTFFRIHIPLLAPAITGAAVLTMIAFLEAFDIPEVIGLPAGIRVVPTQIYSYINATYGGQYAQASSMAISLILMIIALIAAQWRLLGNREFTTVSGKTYRTERWKLGRARWLSAGALVIYALVALALPVTQLVLGSLQSFFGLYKNYSLNNYRMALDDPQIVGALRSTAVLSILGGLVTMLCCIAIAALVRARRGLLNRLISLSVWMPMALPGIVLGLGIMWSFLSVPVLSQLYATIWILLVGLFIATVPIGMRVAESALVQIPDDLEEAARISGASRLRAFLKTVVPLIVPSFFAGWLLTAIMISGNLAVPILLASPDSQTVSVEVFKLYQNGQVAESAAVFCIILAAMAVVAIVFAILRLAFHKSWTLRPTGRGPR